MQLGMIGLGRMGANLARRAMRDGHECVVHDPEPEAAARLGDEGATVVASPAELAAAMRAPRAVWVMVPAGAPTESVLEGLATTLSPGDVVIDGGNSYYRDDLRRAAVLGERGIHLLDCGTSGGVWGLERGYSLMVGGDAEAFAMVEPVLSSLAPGVGTVDRTPGRDGSPATAEQGYLHCGPSGSGHFVKMVHNGVEYGMMAAIAEGMNVLHRANIGAEATTGTDADPDAETTPLANPELYRYDLDLAAIAEVWRRGSVVQSWLVDLLAAALQESPDLESFTGHVSDSGEGRWTAIAAIEEGVPAPVLTAALTSRFASRDLDVFANKTLSALRKQFGGHDERPVPGPGPGATGGEPS